MEARILNQSEEHLWSDFVEKHPLGNIHQTPEWGHFRSKVPGCGKYWIIVIEENEKIIAGTLLLRQSLPRGYSWLYAPRGPLLNYDDSDNYYEAQAQMAALMKEIKKIAKQEKAIFLRVDPMISVRYHPSEICARAQILPEKTALDSHLASGFRAAETPCAYLVVREDPPRGGLAFHDFRQNIHGFQPDHTLILDLNKSEEDLLKEMKPKGRYNIKLAEKKGVIIRRVDSSTTDFHAALSSFYLILSETTSRDGFHGHDQKFYQNMLDSLGAKSVLYLAEFEGKIIAGCLNTFYKNTATYYYGASSNEHRNVMAPYLLQWQAISEAKAKGYKVYDFFGIAPENATNHPWAGVTDFKKKFGGTEISFQLPQELVFKKTLYLLYKVYKKI